MYVCFRSVYIMRKQNDDDDDVDMNSSCQDMSHAVSRIYVTSVAIRNLPFHAKPKQKYYLCIYRTLVGLF